MKLVRRIGVAVAGGTVLLVGIVMIFLPGPSIIVIPMGLAILALEFRWAKRLLSRVKRIISRLKRKWKALKAHKP